MASTEVKIAQIILNQLGYAAGLVDGSAGEKTYNAVKKFYLDTGKPFDGQIDENEIADLREAILKSPRSGDRLSLRTDVSLTNGQMTFIPSDVLEAFYKASFSHRDQYCNTNNSEKRFAISEIKSLSKSPPLRLKGFNSRMDNREKVEGAIHLDRFALRMSELQMSAWVMDNEFLQEVLLASLATWAEKDALLKTYNCKDGSNKKCTQWIRSDGKDSSRAMDYSKAQMEVMHLAYAYYLLLSSYKPKDYRHLLIQNWFENFHYRNKSPAKGNKLGFGLDFGWSWPSIFFETILNANEKPNKISRAILMHAIKRLDQLILDDGSIKNRTTRGNRALWYHLTGLVEALVTLEMARAYGLNVSNKIDEKIGRAFEIFIRGFDDHSYMNKWAKKAHNSIYEPGVQIFKDTLDIPNGNSAFYIFKYRYPNHPVSKLLEKRLSSYKRSARMDGYLGLGLGCVYAVAYDMNKAKSEKNINAGLNRKNANKSQVDLLSKKEVKTEKLEKQKSSEPEKFDARDFKKRAKLLEKYKNRKKSEIEDVNLFPTLGAKFIEEIKTGEGIFTKITVRSENYQKKKNYEEVHYEVANFKLENYEVKRLRFKIMFDYKSPAEQAQRAPELVRLSLWASQLPDPIKLSSLDTCHHGTYMTKNNNLHEIRIALGEDAEDSDCLFSNMSKVNRKIIVALSINLRRILMKANYDKNAMELKEIILSKFQ